MAEFILTQAPGFRFGVQRDNQGDITSVFGVNTSAVTYTAVATMHDTGEFYGMSFPANSGLVERRLPVNRVRLVVFAPPPEDGPAYEFTPPLSYSVTATY